MRFQILAWTLAGIVANTGGLLPLVVAETPRTAQELSGNKQAVTATAVGVVRSPENAATWQAIVARLEAAGVAYQAIDLDSLENAAVIGKLNVLFLPNIATISTPQMKALEAWVSRGGRIVASGPVGDLSSLWVRSRLRNILGAYWAFPLSEQTSLQALPCNDNCPSVPANAANNLLWGGAVIPTGTNSRTLATWNLEDNPPAVAISPRATLLGWYWGQAGASSLEFDVAWLQAALKIQDANFKFSAPSAPQPQTPTRVTAQASVPQPSPTPVVRPVVPPQTRVQPSPTPVVRPAVPPPSAALQPQRSSTAAITSRTNASSVPPPSAAIQLGQQLPPRPTGSTTSSPSYRSTPIPAPSQRPVRRNPIARIAPPPSPKPSPQPTPAPTPTVTASPAPVEAPPRIVAAPAVDPVPQVESPEATPEIIPRQVSSGNLPISSVEAIAIRQDLEKLIGRVASTALATNSATSPTNLSTTNKDTKPDAALENLAPLQEAKDALQTFQTLVNQQDYAGARQQLIEAKEKLLTAYPSTRLPATAEIRAVWFDRGTIVQAGSEAGLAKIFDRLAASGINTIFFETMNAGYPIYPSNIAPKANPLVQGWDPLGSAVKLAHERGIELHAWIWTFAVGNERHNRLAGLPANYPGPVISAHPDWASYDNRGNLIPPGQEKPFLDPANPEARRYLLELIDEIVTTYQVDGVQLDYIRYPFQDPSAERSYGYGQAARAQFKQQTGVDPLTLSPRQVDLWQKWTEFRVEQINSFVAAVSQQLRVSRPGLTLSVAVFPLSEHDRIHKLQQHWEIWARRGDVDLVIPMTYALEGDRFQRLTLPIIANESLGSALIVPGIRLLDLPKAIAIDRIQLLRDQPVLGYSLFAVENLTGELETFLNRTQGAIAERQNEPIPHRRPFKAASARYTALQREWSFLLANDRLWIRDPALKEFSSKSQALEQALTQLAEQPTASNLATAKSLLKSFRSEFKSWMNLQALEQSYQVNTWENRLASIELLLSYGDRIREQNATLQTDVSP